MCSNTFHLQIVLKCWRAKPEEIKIEYDHYLLCRILLLIYFSIISKNKQTETYINMFMKCNNTFRCGYN